MRCAGKPQPEKAAYATASARPPQAATLPAGQGLPPQVASLYSALEVSEARHHQLYLRLAEKHAQAAGLVIAPRRTELARVEAEAATSPDAEFRFHSGEPVAGASALHESDLAPREP